MEAFHFAVLMLALTLLVNRAACDLRIHFYQTSCPAAESIVRNVSRQLFAADPTLPAGLLRLQFHDCWIRGCEASILLDSTDSTTAEKEAAPNLTLRGFDEIDIIKAAVEAKCPGIVSCADILAMAVREGCAFSGGSAYDLLTGRLDGTVSLMSEVDIPGPDFSIEQASEAFQSKGFTLDDLTTLLGGHSMGFSHCGFFLGRLYNFLNSGGADPSIDPDLLLSLQNSCPPSLVFNTNVSADPKVNLNQNTTTPFLLTNSFFQGLLNQKAVLLLDQELAFNETTLAIVNTYIQKPNTWRKKFARAMIKLTTVLVLAPGEVGEVRSNCRVVNSGNVNNGTR